MIIKSKEEMKRIAKVAAGNYSTHKSDQVSIDTWLRAKEISRHSADVRAIIDEQTAKVAGT